MSIDISSLPFSPLLLVVGVGYAVISTVGTGPEIIRRELQNSGWHATCQSELKADIDASRQPERVIPQVPDIGGLLCNAYPELGDLCRIFPDPNAAAREAKRKAHEVEQARIRRAVSRTADACACAEQVFVENQKLSVAAYAASGRLISPPAITNRDVGLFRALTFPLCKREG